ncbi:ribosome silencing factor [Cysteiniphilum sp. 6C5]|uniref:ribosome silencing factor n=1 Tax=unclassified Cysteiniphilum TaxID=2610889 RepID=UPI003F87F5F5
METKEILDLAVNALEDVKAEDITVMNVEHLTELMSYVVVCTANSGTHAKALASNLEMTAKKNNVTILGIEGEVKSDWVLVDLADIVVHIMKAETREFYQLEKLWDIKPNSPKAV